ncbi:MULTISPECIES: Rrf2 family transcriptional regulator [unclassified Stappia]|uniref:Rrf2 family transcriptional regulator n=1 Tax=unclassified Stappia TaxID=2629676 RepID=UPI001643CF00|nr:MULTISPECIES: Rrf2 family transcriptional regulator [unclassified Stappia]
MRLTLQTDYALRMMMHLAVMDGELVTIGDVAETFRISKNHLMKVAQALAHAGLVETVRGRSGGLRLARPADRIQVGAIVRRLEQQIALVDCFPGGNGTCRITPACQLKPALFRAREAFFAVLDEYTIHDLVSGNAGLKDILVGEAA